MIEWIDFETYCIDPSSILQGYLVVSFVYLFISSGDQGGDLVFEGWTDLKSIT